MAFLQHHGPAPLSWLIVALALGVGCGDGAHSARNPAAPAAHDHGHGHSHVAPHGGTVVVLGDEAYHLELVHDHAAGRLTLYVLDGHMEHFIRLPVPSLQVTCTLDGNERPLTLAAVAQAATGESVGNTCLLYTSDAADDM
jgi:hypothetical protein